ncbi:MAG: CotH kinase family protein [Anaerolineaceae bacterium]
MRFKQIKNKKSDSKFKKFWKSSYVKVILILLLLGFSFIGGALAHKYKVTAKLRTVFGIVEKNVDKVTEVIENDIAQYSNNGLMDLYIDLPFESLEALSAKRKEALEIGILNSEDEDFVPASIQLDDSEKIDVNVRLKGDWSDHYASDKWSLRIELDNNTQAFLGMTKFSIQAPETREFLNEWGYHQTLIQEGILTTRYHFVNVTINGEYKGIYAVEESFTENLLESQGHREGILFRFDEDTMWANWSSFRSVGGEAFMLDAEEAGTFLVMDDDSADIAIFRGNRVEANPVLEAEAETAVTMLRSFQKGELKASEVFDVEKLGTFFAVTDLWAGNHATIWHNIRFYYNPITARLEPVGYDANPLTYYSVDVATFPYAIPDMFDDAEIQEAYVRAVERIIDPQYLADLRESLEPDFLVYQEALSKEYTSGLDAPWERLEIRRSMLEINLVPENAVRGGYERIWKDGKKYLQVDLINQMILPVQVSSLEINGDVISLQKEWFSQTNKSVFLDGKYSVPTLEAGESTNYQTYQFLIPFDWVEPAGEDEEETFMVNAEVNLLGESQTAQVLLSEKKVAQELEENPRPVQPTPEEFLSSHSYISKIDENTMIVQPGTWVVDGDLILPEDVRLVIPEGTTLRFEEQAILFTTSPISMYGSEENPVKLTSQDTSWGGIVVLSAQEQSLWQFAIVENMTSIAREGWILTGGITFYESPITLENVQIRNATSEDAINVVQSDFEFINSEFAHAASDAFDGDFTNGKVKNCSFHDIEGDGVDVSGSTISISDSTFTNITDKAVSVGEDSDVEITTTVIDSVGIGVASKDLSQVTITDSKISNAKVAGLAAYIKKPVFGPAKITTTNTSIEANTIALVQTGSTIIIDSEEIPTVDIDVESLYEQGILGN